MAAAKRPVRSRGVARSSARTPAAHRAGAAGLGVEDVVGELRRLATPATRAGMARYGIPSDNALGVTVGALRTLGRSIGLDHALAAALWKTGIYEARMLAAFVDDPKLVTPAQMERWCEDFDNWAITDHVCFHLFDKVSNPFEWVERWADRKAEFERRAAFALLASVALHGRGRGFQDDEFRRCFPLIERAARDPRNLVKKGVSWALRGIGLRVPSLRGEAIELAERLARSSDTTARWIGKDALRDLTKPGAGLRKSKKRAPARGA